MNPLLLGPILDLFNKVADKVWPDPEKKAQAQLELVKMQQAGDFKELEVNLALAQGQMDINKVEAASSDPFTSRARPFIMWVCGLSLLYAALIDPFARFIATVFYHYTGSFPEIDTTITLQVLFGLLGLGGFRTLEKIRGVAK
jgi:hypothetical protein